MSPSPTILSVSPHPDDELIGAPATLMALRDAGWRVINLVCSLGRPKDRPRRQAELERACALAGFELVVPDGMPASIGATANVIAAQQELAAVIAGKLADLRPEVVVGPSPHDGHHGHELVGRSIRDAVEKRGKPSHAMFWGVWADLPLPNVLVAFGTARLAEIKRALGAHAGELARNRLDRLLEGRAMANAVLGPERVFGFGAHGIDETYAELLTHVSWRPSDGWRLTAPRMLEPSQLLAFDDGPDIAWWLHAPSVRGSLRSGWPGDMARPTPPVA